MCTHDDVDPAWVEQDHLGEDRPHEEDTSGGPVRPSRRAMLSGAAAALAAPLVLRGGPAVAAGGSSVTGQGSVLAAMHMHGSFSEEQGSWQGQAWRMRQESVDLLFMTDHSHSLLASGMAADLGALILSTATTGRLAASKATHQGGALSLLARSADTNPASSAVLIDPVAKANRLLVRTSVMGQVWRHRFGTVTVDRGGRYEVRVGLSHHPATGGRPEGTYALCFRFGPGLAPARLLEDGGLTGVVVQPLPTSGTTVDLDLAREAALAWPDLITEDNDTQWASFTAVSPSSFTTCAVDVAGVALTRAARTPAAVAGAQSAMAARYGADYGVSIVPSVELGTRDHHNAFLDGQYFSAWEDLVSTNPASYTRQNIQAIHAAGGLASWNHPFGATVGTPLTGAAAATKRRAVYQQLRTTDLYGADLLEVGYGVRGNMSIEDHLGLWDTFSRQARFLTGNGVSDSHDSTRNRMTSGNEFATGIWSTTTAMADVLPALASGRAYTRHAGFWPGGEIDLVVDGTIRMGQVAVGPASTRVLTITATHLPTGALVEVVAGAVDYAGTDPTATVVARLTTADFGSSGTASTRLQSLPPQSFVRLTVRDRAGAVIGIGNPVWLLTSPPPTGIPPARRA